MSYLLIVDSISGNEAYPPAYPEGAAVCLLSFSPSREITDRIADCLAEDGVQMECINAAGKLDNVALKARERFSELVAKIPLSFQVRGRNLKCALTFEGRLSIWWLNELSTKRSDLYPTFTRICQVEVILDVVRSARPEAVDVLTEDGDFWDVVAALCRTAGIHVRLPPPVGRYRASFHRFAEIIRIFGRSVLWFLRTGIQMLLAKFMVGSGTQRHADEEPCAFYTHYPGMWRGSGGTRDDIYAGVPFLLSRIWGVPTVYACTFSADGSHQSVSVRDYYRHCQWLKGEMRTSSGCGFYLMDADLRWSDLWRAVSHISIVLKYLQLELTPDFRNVWLYDGVNIFPLIRREFRMAMRRIPRYVLHALRVRRFVERVHPRCFVTYLFEYCYGRAMVFGVKTVKDAPPVVGVQHGPYAKRKLLNYHYPGELLACPGRPSDFIENAPIPDLVIIEGEGAKERLSEAGYPADRLVVAGAPRLAGLRQVPHKGTLPPGDFCSRKNVLVVFGQHDAAGILSVCSTVMRQRSDCHFILKLHPKGGFSEERVRAVLDSGEMCSTYEIERGVVYDRLSQADVVLTTYSSVGMEAMVKGYPVICLHLPNVVNGSPMLDIETPGVVNVTNSDELESAINNETLFNCGDNGNQSIRKYFFSGFGEDAEGEWAKAILSVLNSHKQNPGH